MANNIIIDTKELKKVALKLSGVPKQIPGATAAALNRTLTYTITQTTREVTKKYSIKSRDIKKTIKKHKASKSKLNACMESRGSSIALHKFPHTPRKYSKRSKAVKVQIIKSKGKKTINTSPKAFVQTMNNTNGIFKRKSKKRTPVVILRTISVPQMISNEETMTKIEKLANNKLKERISHEIDWRLSKVGK